MLNNKLEIVLVHGKMRTLKHFNLYKVGLHLRNVLLACLGPSAFISHTSTQCRGGAGGVKGAAAPLTPPNKVLHIFIKLSCTLKVRGGVEGVKGVAAPLTPPNKVLHIIIKLSCTLKVRI